jgi:hypothetical protein
MKVLGAPKRGVVGTPNDAVKMVGHGTRMGDTGRQRNRHFALPRDRTVTVV